MARKDSEIVRREDQPSESSGTVIKGAALSMHSGPLPAPEDLAKYDMALAGAAERILAMAERQQQHRHELERIAIRDNGIRSRWGLACGFIVAMTAIAGGVYAIVQGHDIAGATVAGGSLVGLVSVFVIGINTQKAERIEKVRLLTGEEKEA